MSDLRIIKPLDFESLNVSEETPKSPKDLKPPSPIAQACRSGSIWDLKDTDMSPFDARGGMVNFLKTALSKRRSRSGSLLQSSSLTPRSEAYVKTEAQKHMLSVTVQGKTFHTLDFAKLEDSLPVDRQLVVQTFFKALDANPEDNLPYGQALIHLNKECEANPDWKEVIALFGTYYSTLEQAPVYQQALSDYNAWKEQQALEKAE